MKLNKKRVRRHKFIEKKRMGQIEKRLNKKDQCVKFKKLDYINAQFFLLLSC